MTSPFFRTCPFCRQANVSISSYGNGSVSCECGVVVAVKTTSWEALQEAAEKWNEEVERMVMEKNDG